jgi:aminomethyltransferase
VALAYVRVEHAGEERFLVHTTRQELPASRTELPFYRQGTARRKL